MQTPNPILLGQTPADGFTLAVTDDPGGLSGYVLLGQHGPPLTVEVSANGGLDWTGVAYPYTLAAGVNLRLTRSDDSGELSTLRALAPVQDAAPPPAPEPYTVSTGPDGAQTITNADVTTDPGGYQTISDATPTTDPDGYVSVERS